MKKGETYTLKIEHNKYPNIGVAYYEGKKVQVKNVLRGQTVSSRISKKRQDRIEGRALEVLQRSDDETASFCEHFGACGGCVFQTLTYDNQLALKTEMVKRLFEDSGLPFPLTSVVASPDVFEYRNKMEFSFGDERKDGPLTLGMHKKNRHHDVVTVEHCHLADSDFRSILAHVLDYAKKMQWPKYNKHSHSGFLRHLVVRKGVFSQEIMVALSASTQFEWDTQAFVDMLKALPLKGKLASVLFVKNDGLGDVVSGPVDVIFGKDTIQETLLGLSFDISLYSFFQTNTKGAERLYEEAIQMIPNIEGKLCFDLFSGTGTIAQIMAQKAKRVIGIEIVKDAVDVAKQNAIQNGLSNCTFLCGDVFQVLSQVDEKPDVIVVDPPRSGMGEKTTLRIAAYNMDEIVYISCNPKTLLEDLMVFQKEGYILENVVLVDMFPWTSGVECVAKIKKHGSTRQ